MSVVLAACRGLWSGLIEPAHNNSNKMTGELSEDSDQPGYPPSLISLRWALSE